MIDFLNIDSNKIIISEFYENIEKYDYDTVYQRDKVWSEEKKSFLIDSILKNYPIPPIFLRMKINSETGKTRYEVIDGKQRLTTIKDFIEGKISLPEDFGEDNIGNAELNGACFNDIRQPQYTKYVNQFWGYRIPVIFIETEDNEIVKSVFDRLNRNGEPLLPQELRHAKYGETKLYEVILQIKDEHPWRNMFNNVLEVERKEDDEFISELLFVLLEKKIITYTKSTLDDLYKKWKDNINIAIVEEFLGFMKYIEQLDLKYDELKIAKVSHLYAIWIVGILAKKQGIEAVKLKKCLEEFFESYLNKEEVIGVEDYIKSMSSNTKSSGSRKKRVQALLDYVEANGIELLLEL